MKYTVYNFGVLYEEKFHNYIYKESYRCKCLYFEHLRNLELDMHFANVTDTRAAGNYCLYLYDLKRYVRLLFNLKPVTLQRD